VTAIGAVVFECKAMFYGWNQRLAVRFLELAVRLDDESVHFPALLPLLAVLSGSAFAKLITL